MERDIFESLTQDELDSLRDLKEHSGYAVLEKIANEIVPVNLGLQMVDLDVDNEEDRILVKENKRFMEAIKFFMKICENSSPGEVQESYEKDFMPEYDPSPNR